MHVGLGERHCVGFSFMCNGDEVLGGNAALSPATGVAIDYRDAVLVRTDLGDLLL